MSRTTPATAAGFAVVHQFEIVGFLGSVGPSFHPRGEWEGSRVDFNPYSGYGAGRIRNRGCFAR